MPPKIERPLTTDQLRGAPIFGLLDVLARELDAARARLGDVFFEPLLSRLFGLLDRVMVTELRAARNAGLLTGDTPAARFDHFCAALRHDDGLAGEIRARYPVVFERATVLLDDGVAAAEELRARLDTDRARLALVFFEGRTPGAVARIDVRGDLHRCGRAVTRVTFDGGAAVYYKPRPLALERRFYAILDHLNAHGATPAFGAPAILDRGEYGWMAPVVAAGVTSTEAAGRYYARLGGLIAITHALGVTDLHAENVIAAGEHPLLADLEVAFQPERPAPGSRAARAVAGTALGRSVVGTGLVPSETYFSATGAGLDVSGATAEAATSSVRLPVWIDAGTDDMRLERREVALDPADNGLRLNGAPVDVREHLVDLEAGFVATYRRLADHRATLPLDGLEGVHARVLLRSTNVYARLIGESGHPKLAGDEASLARFFDKLRLPVDRVPELGRVVAAEQADLERCDVPVFTAALGDRAVFTSSGERIDDYFVRSGLDATRDRLAALGDDDLERQRWILRASIAASRVADIPACGLPEDAAPFRSVLAIREACRIGDRLLDLAIHGDGDITWIGVEPVSQTRFALEPLTVDLYDGLAGVALFLAQLGALTGEARFSNAARRAARGLVDQIQDERALVTTAGGFVGWGGLVYALDRLGRLLGDDTLFEQADRSVEALRALVGSGDPEPELDVVAGLAGGIAALLHTARDLDLARAAGDVLAGQPFRGLTGFSHGAGGVAWALFALHRETGAPHYRAAALDAIAYERSHFLEGRGNWADLRANAHACQTLWCHGAPGVALARLDVLDELDDDAFARSEIRTAIETTLRSGFGFNHSLCHGDLGNVEIVMRAARALGDARWADAAESLAARIVTKIAEAPCTGVPGGIESPGLMTGLAGIGYGLLRLAAPDRVPSVLTLEIEP